MEKTVVGWREWIGFPDLGIAHIKAKVDTGARTSCLHAFFIETFQRDNNDWVRFDIHPKQRNTERVVRCEAALLERRIVRDSGGHEELRYVIQTPISLGGVTLDTEVTLTDRDSMKFRVLLGRSALVDRFIVDPGQSYIVGASPNRKKKSKKSALKT